MVKKSIGKGLWYAGHIAAGAEHERSWMSGGQSPGITPWRSHPMLSSADDRLQILLSAYGMHLPLQQDASSLTCQGFALTCVTINVLVTGGCFLNRLTFCQPPTIPLDHLLPPPPPITKQLVQ